MITIQTNTKYYKITSRGAFNIYSGNFYRILRTIGLYYKGTKSSCVKFSLNLIREKIRSKGFTCSNTEIRSLIQAKHLLVCRDAKATDKYIVYKMSHKSDMILKTMFDLFEKAKNDKNFDHTVYYGNRIDEGHFCRIQMIHAIDEKLDQIFHCSPKKHKSNIDNLRDNIKEIRTEC